jgi:hypothetical protein
MGSFATHFLEEIGEQVEQVEQVDTKKWEKTWHRHRVDRNVYSQKNNMTHLDIQNFGSTVCLLLVVFLDARCARKLGRRRQSGNIFYIFLI